MTDSTTTARRATVNREEGGNILGVVLVLGAADLAALGIDPTETDAVVYRIDDGGLRLDHSPEVADSC